MFYFSLACFEDGLRRHRPPKSRFSGSGVPVLSKDDRMFYADYQKKKNGNFFIDFLS